jgi:hypothetical protein
MALRIACDLDGTLADMESALQREAERLFGSNVDLRAGENADPAVAEPDDPPKNSADALSLFPSEAKRALTRAEIRRLWAHVRTLENFWTTLCELEPGAVARLASLAAQYGWEVIFLTQRPATQGDTAQVQAQRWLEACGFPRPSVFVISGSRGKIADAFSLDVVIDDRRENALDVAADSKARPILVWRGSPPSSPAAARDLGILVVRSFGEAIDCLEEMTRGGTAARRLMSRLRAAIGF